MWTFWANADVLESSSFWKSVGIFSKRCWSVLEQRGESVIEKSVFGGSGIEKSVFGGPGIEKSGSAIEKSVFGGSFMRTCQGGTPESCVTSVYTRSSSIVRALRCR